MRYDELSTLLDFGAQAYAGFFWGCTFFVKKLTTFLVVARNTQAKTAKSTTPTLHLCLRVHLQLTPINYTSHFFPLRGCTCTECTPRLRLCFGDV